MYKKEGVAFCVAGYFRLFNVLQPIFEADSRRLARWFCVKRDARPAANNDLLQPIAYRRVGKLLLPHLLLPVGAFLTGIPLSQALLGAMNRLSSRRDVAVCQGASIPDCGTSYLARETTVSTG